MIVRQQPKGETKHSKNCAWEHEGCKPDPQLIKGLSEHFFPQAPNTDLVVEVEALKWNCKNTFTEGHFLKECILDAVKYLS